MFSNYYDLVAKVDAKFREIQETAGSSITCHPGCHGCCQPGLTMSRVEKEAIRTALTKHPEKLAEARRVHEEQPHGASRCRFLSKEGQCSIYEYRPLICRSHGVPIRFREDQALKKDVCPLNFKGQPLADLPETQFINLELLNTILALINEQAFGRQGRERYALTLDAIMAY